MLAKDLVILVARRRAHAFAWSLARRFRDAVERDEVLGVADLGIARAVACYDASRGPLEPWILTWVRREVMRLVARELRWRATRSLGWGAVGAGDDEPWSAADEGVSHETPFATVAMRELVETIDYNTLRALAARGCGGEPVCLGVAESEPLSYVQVQRRLRRLRLRLEAEAAAQAA